MKAIRAFKFWWKNQTKKNVKENINRAVNIEERNGRVYILANGAPVVMLRKDDTTLEALNKINSIKYVMRYYYGLEQE